MFIVEVMGRHAGFLALETAVACGAEFVLVPEIPADIEAIIKKIHYAKEHGKTHSIIVLAEGVMPAHGRQAEGALRLRPAHSRPRAHPARRRAVELRRRARLAPRLRRCGMSARRAERRDGRARQGRDTCLAAPKSMGGAQAARPGHAPHNGYPQHLASGKYGRRARKGGLSRERSLV